MPTITTRDGVHVYYTIHGTGARDVVLLHCLSGNVATWELLLPHMDLQQYRFLAIDFRGTGQSQQELCTITNERLAADILEVADHEGAARFAVIGHSMGAKVGLFLAATHPDRVDRLCLMGSPSPGMVPISREFIEAYIAHPDKPAYTIEIYRPWFVIWPRPQIDAWLDSFMNMPDWALRASCEAALWTDFSDQTPGIQCPILSFLGTHDPFYGPSYFEECVQPHIPQAQTILLDCGHGFILERPEAIAPPLNRFLLSVC